jgi:hypothetical protein
MVLPQAGNTIRFSQLQTEFGGTNPIYLSEYYRNAPSGYTANIIDIPLSGSVIKMSDFSGKSSMIFEYDHIFFAASSTYSFTIPAGFDNMSVLCIGGGGSSTGITYGESSWRGGNGGSGGGVVWANNIKITQGQTFTITVSRGRNGSSLQDDSADLFTRIFLNNYIDIYAATGKTGSRTSAINTAGGDIYVKVYKNNTWQVPSDTTIVGNYGGSKGKDGGSLTTISGSNGSAFLIYGGGGGAGGYDTTADDGAGGNGYSYNVDSEIEEVQRYSLYDFETLERMIEDIRIPKNGIEYKYAGGGGGIGIYGKGSTGSAGIPSSKAGKGGSSGNNGENTSDGKYGGGSAIYDSSVSSIGGAGVVRIMLTKSRQFPSNSTKLTDDRVTLYQN